MSAVDLIYRPMILTAKIFGGTLYNCKGISLFAFVQTTFLATCCVSLTIYYFINYFPNSYGSYKSKTTLRFTLLFRSVIYAGLMLLVIGKGQKEIKTGGKFLNNISWLDRKLVKMKQEEFLAKSNKEIRNHAVFLTILIQFVIHTFGNLFTTFSVVRKQTRWIYFTIIWYPRLIVSIHNLTLLTSLALLQKRFRSINKLINNKKINVYIIEEMIACHRFLTNTTKKFFDHYSIHISIILGVSFVTITADIYCIFNLIMVDEGMINIYVIVHLARSSVSALVELWILVGKCSSTSQEANVTKKILLGIHVGIDKEHYRNFVRSKLFSLKFGYKITTL